jgi:hypothetical protein
MYAVKSAKPLYGATEPIIDGGVMTEVDGGSICFSNNNRVKLSTLLMTKKEDTTHRHDIIILLTNVKQPQAQLSIILDLTK